jgi:hypothetical protein
MREISLIPTYGEHEFQWLKTHGPVYRYKGCFGVRICATSTQNELFSLTPSLDSGGPSDDLRSGGVAVRFEQPALQIRARAGECLPFNVRERKRYVR